jgi:hypothetical protein
MMADMDAVITTRSTSAEKADWSARVTPSTAGRTSSMGSLGWIRTSGEAT